MVGQVELLTPSGLCMAKAISVLNGMERLALPFQTRRELTKEVFPVVSCSGNIWQIWGNIQTRNMVWCYLTKSLCTYYGQTILFYSLTLNRDCRSYQMAYKNFVIIITWLWMRPKQRWCALANHLIPICTLTGSQSNKWPLMNTLGIFYVLSTDVIKMYLQRIINI